MAPRQRHYNRRDEIGHWVDKSEPVERPCEHACCRGFRSHPQDTAVIRSSRKLRYVRERDLVAAFNETSQGDSQEDREASARIMHELERRDAEDMRRREGIWAARAASRMEREAETERVYLAAEAYTRGNWVNKAGRARRVTDREILTGPQAVFDRYASEEAREFFLTHHRPTSAFFRQAA